jgi:Xaa-Pro dipeptidase
MTKSSYCCKHHRGEFGIRLEDDMHVTENRAELFMPQSPALEDPCGKA